MIYFMQPTEGGPVKIGWSDDVETRRIQLQGRYSHPLAILATMPGGRDEEREIHERFAHLRFGRTEQFRPAADLMAFIGRPLLVAPNPDTVEAIKCKKVDITFSIGIKLHRQIQAAADREGNSVASFIRSAVVKELKRREQENKA